MDHGIVPITFNAINIDSTEKVNAAISQDRTLFSFSFSKKRYIHVRKIKITVWRVRRMVLQSFKNFNASR